jgi:uncharacterized membrane protein YjjB (DUF3815 family)
MSRVFLVIGIGLGVIWGVSLAAFLTATVGIFVSKRIRQYFYDG